MSSAIDPGGRPLGVQEAYDALGDYASTYGELPLRLLLHAAVPQSFRADLLNLLKVNFVPEAGGDLSVDADVLLSPLVEATVAGYFRLDPEVRRQSLDLLDAIYRSDGSRRSVRVARFLIARLDQLEQAGAAGMDPLLAEYAVIQRWVALALIDPPAIAAALAKSLSDALAEDETAVRARLGGIAAALSIPLSGHQPLLSYAQGVDALRTGNADEARRLLEPLGDSEIRIGDVTLRPAADLLDAYLPREPKQPSLGPGAGTEEPISAGGPGAIWYEPYVSLLPEFQTFLPKFLPNQRWFAAKGSKIRTVPITDSAYLHDRGATFLLATLDTEVEDGIRRRYFLPLAIAWETATFDPMSQLQPYALAEARMGRRIGVLHDAMASPPFAQAVVRAVRDGREITTSSGGRMVFQPTQAFAAVELPDDAAVERLGREQSNTSVLVEELPDDAAVERLGREQSNTSLLVGEQVIFKAFRRLEPGLRPEIEIGRFLTDVAGFRNTPPLLGSIELIDTEGIPTALGLLQGFVRNQGDGWSFTLDYLHRILSQMELLPAQIEVNTAELHAVYLALARMLGKRVAELHRAFALDVTDPAFRPEPVLLADVEAWTARVMEQATQAQKALAHAFASGTLRPDARLTVKGLLGQWSRVEDLVHRWLPRDLNTMKTRHHGDLHLGQVMAVRDDFYILDFEGEPLRSMEQRSAMTSPLRDVAEMLRSFDYAARTALAEKKDLRPGVGEQLAKTAQEWERLTVREFLESYRETIRGCPSAPTDATEFNRLLNLFVLEKALYEVCYEAANRPDWLAVPAEGVYRLLNVAE